MNVLILGGDGYLGWPTAMRFAAKGHNVWCVDNYLRRNMALETDSNPLVATPTLSERAALFKARTGHEIHVIIGDLADRAVSDRAFADSQPDVVVHYAEQPSAPYSMMSREAAQATLDNNLKVTFNCIWGVIDYAPQAHIIKLGTMGEYGTPNIDIEEGWIDIDHKGRTDKFLFPRAAGSLYHTTKVLDTDLLWFYVRLHDLRVTDLMQGPVYGLVTPECAQHPDLMPHFHYDDIFGTVVNRFLAQATVDIPLTVYGKGGQTRGYINIIDTLKCIEIAASTPPDPGELRIMNQVTETLSVNEIAEKIARVGRQMGLPVEIRAIDNPRKEREEHYYNPVYSSLGELGLDPTLMSDEAVAEMLEIVGRYAKNIDAQKIMPRVSWT